MDDQLRDFGVCAGCGAECNRLAGCSNCSVQLSDRAADRSTCTDLVGVF